MSRTRLSPSTRSIWRQRLFYTIFESETREGKLFDIVLIVAISASVLVVMLDSVHAIHIRWASTLHLFEWFFTLLFTIEYLVRLSCVKQPWHYARSFFGIVDLISILPAFFSLLLSDTIYVVVIRVLRVLRVFRILKLGAYLGEADILISSLKASAKKIEVFLFAVLMLVVIFGALMYVIEGHSNGFTSIPQSIYWAIVTLTTVGYGDMAPSTPLGQALASVIMISGYGIIAVPTGIVSAEMVRASQGKVAPVTCTTCQADLYDEDAIYCKYCGHPLVEISEE